MSSVAERERVLTGAEKARQREIIQSELREIGKQMAGINPKLSTWQKLKERMELLNNRLTALRT